MTLKRCSCYVVNLSLTVCICALSFAFGKIFYNPNFSHIEKEDIFQFPEVFSPIAQSAGSTASASAFSLVEFKTNPATESQFFNFNAYHKYRVAISEPYKPFENP